MTAPSTVPLAKLFQLEVFLLHRVHKHREHPHGWLLEVQPLCSGAKKAAEMTAYGKRTICKEHVWEPGGKAAPRVTRGYAEQTEGPAVITPRLGGHLS